MIATKKLLNCQIKILCDLLKQPHLKKKNKKTNKKKKQILKSAQHPLRPQLKIYFKTFLPTQSRKQKLPVLRPVKLKSENYTSIFHTTLSINLFLANPLDNLGYFKLMKITQLNFTVEKTTAGFFIALPLKKE